MLCILPSVSLISASEFSKQVLAKKGIIKLNFTDVFNTNNFYIKSAVVQTTIDKRYDLDNRVATIALTYRI